MVWQLSANGAGILTRKVSEVFVGSAMVLTEHEQIPVLSG